MKENCLILKMARSRRYPTKIIANADYTVDLVLLATTPAQVECLLNSLEHVGRSNGFYVE